jgi:hypothetical protein
MRNQKHLPTHSHQNGGHRLRVDVLVVLLVRNITPYVFTRLRLHSELEEHKKKRHTAATGSAPIPRRIPRRERIPLAFYEPNEILDIRAQTMVCVR